MNLNENQNCGSNTDIIHEYTLDDAANDGILVSVADINRRWEKGYISHITNNLLYSKGYIKKNPDEDGDFVSIPNIFDLLVQAQRTIKRGFKKGETRFFTGRPEFPLGHRGTVYIVRNESGRYTIMLPEDY